MRSILAALLIVAVTVTGFLVALDLALVLGSPLAVESQRPENPASPDDVSLVHDFYDAANDLLAGENGWGLKAVVSPGLLTHLNPGGFPGGYDALTAHFAALQQQGDLRLSAVQIIGRDRDFTVLVEARAPTPTGSSGRDDESPALWQTIDRFRVQDGTISDYWPGAIESRPLPRLPLVTMERTPADAVVALARLELGREGRMRALSIPSPQLLFIETGIVTLPRPKAVALARAGRERLDSRPVPQDGEDVLLGPGDAMLVPANSGQDVFNHGEKPAAILSIVVAPREMLYGSTHKLTQDMLVAAAMHDPGRIGTRTEWATDVVSEALAVGAVPHAKAMFRTTHLTSRQHTLAPGVQEDLTPSSLLTFVIVTSGLMSAQSVPATNAGLATPSADHAPDVESVRLLRAGDALAVEPETRLLLQNEGASRLGLAIIEVEDETP